MFNADGVRLGQISPSMVQIKGFSAHRLRLCECSERRQHISALGSILITVVARNESLLMTVRAALSGGKKTNIGKIRH
jgi:hypothetical protein